MARRMNVIPRLVLFCTLGTLAGSRANAGPTTRPILLCPYYTWYERADSKQPWSHWTYPEVKAIAGDKNNPLAKPGDPLLASTAYPLAGLYSSGDRAVADWHVKLAKSVGIDAFLVSWWGEKAPATKRFEEALLPAAKQQGMKLALLDELAQYHKDTDVHARALAKALKKYLASGAYFHVDDRPVVYLYQVAQDPGLTPATFARTRELVEAEVSQVYWIVDKLAHDPKPREEAKRKRIPTDWLAQTGVDAFAFYGTYAQFREYSYDVLGPRYAYLVDQAHGAGRKMFVPVHPGFDNSRFTKDGFVMPRENGKTLDTYLRAAREAGADGIILTSWNEWPETTAIEPAATWDDPYLYLRKVADFTGSDVREFLAPPAHRDSPRLAPAATQGASSESPDTTPRGRGR
jgi:hypothetical protein